MREGLVWLLITVMLSGCGWRGSSFVKIDGVALGRVVVYRNGVAFYQRRARVSGGKLTVSVPRDRVDDFLKSLTVVDAKTDQPLPVSIPRQQADDGTYLVMTLQVPTKDEADVVLTYVTESPAWKPSYRVVVGQNGKVMLEGWAIVDNMSGEDWRGVLVGVGSSSALSFRYDLWSVRQVHRELLASEEKFAVAPPTGVSPYQADSLNKQEQLFAEFDDEEIRRPPGHPAVTRAIGRDSDGAATEVQERVERVPLSGGSSGRRARPAKASPSSTASPRPAADPRVQVGDAKLTDLTRRLNSSKETIVVEGLADANSGKDAVRRATDRANIVKNSLIDRGVAPARIKVVTRVEPNNKEGVRLNVEKPEVDVRLAANREATTDTSPVGESHFVTGTPMTVERGASAMVSMVRSETPGEVVYLYDADSARGNEHFAFRAVRFLNPTGSTLETGPVTVYGNGRFVGEGLTEPIPPTSPAVVPFALDRQLVVERNRGEEARIARLVTLQRGILTAQVQQIKRQKLAITNRLHVPAKLYIRHPINKGWTLLDHPKNMERVGDAYLFQVDLKAGEVGHIEIAEATPIERTLDLNADVTLEMMKVYIEAPEGGKELKEQLRKLLAAHKRIVDIASEQDSLRRRLADYKGRMDDLHAQLVTLQAVKTGNDLMAHLRTKMRDISNRVQKATIDIVDQEERLMLARVQFQDMLAELSLEPSATGTAVSTKNR